ncbi:hypothetical protein D3C84_1092780 [compost metagenome]
MRNLKEIDGFDTRIILQPGDEEDVLPAIVIESGVIHVASVNHIGYTRFIRKLIELRAIILFGIRDGCLLWHHILFAYKGQSQVDLDACLIFSERCPFVLLQAESNRG